jgi:hypothetical protein
MNPIIVQLTDTEAKAIIQFVEFGIRQNGSQAARIGLPIQDKVALAIDAASKPQPTPPPTNVGGELPQP